MKYLGIDYGQKKIGLAVSEGELAEPFQALEISSLKDALDRVLKVCKEQGIEKVVIGLPDSGQARKLAEKFINELQKLGEEIIVVDETLSSQIAIEQMINIGASKKSRKKEDAFAAAQILQNYLDSLRINR